MHSYLRYVDDFSLECEAPNCDAVLRVCLSTVDRRRMAIVQCELCCWYSLTLRDDNYRRLVTVDIAPPCPMFNNDSGEALFPRFPQSPRWETIRAKRGSSTFDEVCLPSVPRPHPPAVIELPIPPPISTVRGITTRSISPFPTHATMTPIMATSSHRFVLYKSAEKNSIAQDATPNVTTRPMRSTSVANSSKKERCIDNAANRGGKRRKLSVYNRFISLEVRRLRTMNPSMDHREAFRTAATSWSRDPAACRSMVAQHLNDVNERNTDDYHKDMKETPNEQLSVANGTDPITHNDSNHAWNSFAADMSGDAAVDDDASKPNVPCSDVIDRYAD